MPAAPVPVFIVQKMEVPFPEAQIQEIRLSCWGWERPKSQSLVKTKQHDKRTSGNAEPSGHGL